MDAAEEIVQDEVVTKDISDEADASIAQHTHHRSETSR